MKRGDVCYGMLRAAACVDESNHHALMYVRHHDGQTVRESMSEACEGPICMYVITAGRDLYKSCARGGGVKRPRRARGDVCYHDHDSDGMMLRAPS